MEPLITIESVPISIEYVRKQPTRSSNKQSVQLQFSKQEDGMMIQSMPIRIQMRDAFVPNPSNPRGDGTYTASACFSGSGNLRMNFLYENNMGHIDFDLSQLPSGFPEVNNIDTSFLPPDLEFEVIERPKIIIKYVGGPLYIPKSADPHYVPSDEDEKQINSIFDTKA